MKLPCLEALMVLTILVSACASPPPSVTPSATIPPSATRTSQPTSIPSATATITAIPTRSFSLPTSPPSSNGTVLHLDKMLFDETLVPDCNLPCWRGLMIGQSTRDDTQYVFDNSFGTHGEKNIGLSVLTVGAVNNKPSLGYLWGIDGDTGAGNFAVSATFDPTTDRLDSLEFRGGSEDPMRFEIQLSPELVIKALGKPDRIYGHAEFLGSIREGFGELVMVYNKKGLVFSFWQIVRTRVTFDESLTRVREDIFPFCLGKTKANHESIHVELQIVPPLEDGLEKLSARQEELILSYEVRQRLMPVQDIFNVTEEEFTQLALSGNNVCLESKNLWAR